MLWVSPAVVEIAPARMLAIVLAAAIAGTISALAARRALLLPAVVLELLFGIVLGPQVVGWDVTPVMAFLANLGLGLLFFFAGYEIDIGRIKGHPLRLAIGGWALSLALAYSIGGALAAAGIVLSLLYTGSALATTAIGTLLPILSDSGELETRFGAYLLAAGAIGEFGPIMLVTLVLSTQSTVHNALILLAFIVLCVLVAVLAMRSSGRTVPLMQRTLESSSQLAVRWILVLVFALALLAYELGLDLLLGGFAAGVIIRQVLRDQDAAVFDSKLTAVAFGIFVPFFFVVSGMRLDVGALFESAANIAKMFLFLGLFLVVRGTPALVLYRGVLDARDRAALAFLSSAALPLVLAITTLAVTGRHMRPATAAALVGAAVLSTVVYPILGLRVRAGAQAAPESVQLAHPPP